MMPMGRSFSFGRSDNDHSELEDAESSRTRDALRAAHRPRPQTARCSSHWIPEMEPWRSWSAAEISKKISMMPHSRGFAQPGPAFNLLCMRQRLM